MCMVTYPALRPLRLSLFASTATTGETEKDVSANADCEALSRVTRLVLLAKISLLTSSAILFMHVNACKSCIAFHFNQL